MNNYTKLIVNDAIQALKTNTGFIGKYEGNELSYGENLMDDGTLILSKKEFPGTWKFRLLIKKEFLPHHFSLVEQLLRSDTPFLVVTGRISQTSKKLLQSKKFCFVETSGNAYIEQGSLFILIEGKKNSEKKNPQINRAFAGTGLKVIFQMLLDPELINLTYREIANNLKISFTNISYIFNDLVNEGFIPYNKTGFRALHKKTELLNRWAYAFVKKLKPNLLLGKYRFLQEDKFNDWAKLKFDNNLTIWSGEPAGDLLTNHLKPEYLTLYTEEPILNLIKKLGLVPDREGKISIYQKFWKGSADLDGQVAPIYLIYSDLITANDERCLETAGIIYERYISRKLSEN